MKRFWMSDTHFGHFNVIKYSNRPFLHEVQDHKILFNGKVIKDFEIKGNQVFDQGKLIKELKNDSEISINQFLESSMKYNSVKLMDETMIENWNKVIGKDDLVYFVGDFAFGGTQRITEVLRRLNGRKILIKGNHDKKAELMLKSGFDEVHNELEIEVGGEKVLMSHYPYVDLEVYQAAEQRPNVMKIHKKGYNFKPEDIPQDKWDYPLMRKFIMDNYKRPFNHNTDLGKIAFRLMKRFVMALIGTRPLNKGQILIHGHTHNEKRRNHNMINMSVEAWNYSPVSEEEIIKLIKEIKNEMNIYNLTKDDLEDSKYDYYKKLVKCVDYKGHCEGILKEFQELSQLAYTEKAEHLHVPREYSQAWLKKAQERNLFIGIKDLEDGAYYLGNCRNASVAKWNKAEEKFTYIREKFGARFPEDILPIEKDNGYDLFVPFDKYEPTEEELKEFEKLGL